MNKIEIVIGDKKYNVKTDESPEYVKKIESMLNDQINIIASQNKRFNDIDRLILSSFVIVDKYIKLDKENMDYKKEICDEIQSLKEAKEAADIEKEEAVNRSADAIKEKEIFKERLSARDNDREYFNQQISKLQGRVSEQEQQLLKSEMLINELKSKNKNLDEINDQLTKEKEKFTKEGGNSLISKISMLQNKLKEKDETISSKDDIISDLRENQESLKEKYQSIDDEKEKYLEELLMVNSDKESLNNMVNQLREKLNREEAENFQNQLEISQLKKENTDLMELLDVETAK